MGDAADMAMDIEMGLCDEDGIPLDLPDPPRRRKKRKRKSPEVSPGNMDEGGTPQKS